MRAIYYPFSDEPQNKKIIITGDHVKHLLVVRVKIDESILVLNGRGIILTAKVASISKHEIELLIESINRSTTTHEICLAIANPKKEAFEDILKMAVELGVRHIYPLTSEYSQMEYIHSERIQRILESSLIQSNNPYLPIIFPQGKLEDFLEQNLKPLYFFNSKPVQCGKVEKIFGAKTILIGPEGGFSSIEIEKIMSKSHHFSIHLPTPILRAPTAVASSIGYLLSLQ